MGDYIEGKLSRKELGEFYHEHIATEQNKVTAATILNAPDINPGDKGRFSDETKTKIVKYHDEAIQEIKVRQRIENARKRIATEHGKTPKNQLKTSLEAKNFIKPTRER